MDNLQNAKHAIDRIVDNLQNAKYAIDRATDRLDSGAGHAEAHAQVAIAYALIALVERLDKMTYSVDQSKEQTGLRTSGSL